MLIITLRNIVPVFFVALTIHLPVIVAAEEVDPEKMPLTGIPVEAVAVEQGNIRAMVYGQGTARALKREFLTFEAEGQITYIKPGVDGRELSEGDRVHGPENGELNGELIASLDSRDSLAQLEVAEAAVAQAKQELVASKADLARAQAEQEVALTQLKRMETLVQSGVIAKADYDNAAADAKQARAAVVAAQAGIRATESTVSSALAQLQQAQLNVERTSIFAPIDGIIAYLNIREGQYFSQQRIDTQSEANALRTVPVVVIDPGTYEITVELPSFQGSRVAPNQSAFIYTGETSGPSQRGDRSPTAYEAAVATGVHGSVFSVSPAINPGGRSIRATIRTTEGADELKDGMFVTCWLVVEEKEGATTLPRNTLLFEGQKTFVFVLSPDMDTVERREVEIGINGLDRVEILNGVSPGEQVIGRGRNRLTTGTRVEVVSKRETTPQ